VGAALERCRAAVYGSSLDSNKRTVRRIVAIPDTPERFDAFNFEPIGSAPR
jgi:hypothetical protein